MPDRIIRKRCDEIPVRVEQPSGQRLYHNRSFEDQSELVRWILNPHKVGIVGIFRLMHPGHDIEKSAVTPNDLLANPVAQLPAHQINRARQDRQAHQDDQQREKPESRNLRFAWIGLIHYSRLHRTMIKGPSPSAGNSTKTASQLLRRRCSRHNHRTGDWNQTQSARTPYKV